MAYTVIDNPGEYFNSTVYNGNESTNVITTGLANDFVWVKAKDSAGVNHYLFDSVRGVQKNLHSNTTDAEVTEANTLTAFNSDGFTLGSDSYVNGSGQPHANWNWRAGGSASTNTNGNVDTTVSANPTAGFSIISANTGSTTGELTLGHGLNAVPSMFIWKNRDDAGQNWQVYHKSTGTGLMRLNDTGAVNTDVTFWNTHTTTLFKMTTHMYAQNKNFIGYCFADVKGYQKSGSFIGNGNVSGSYTHLGFSPAFLFLKNTADSGASWQLFDNKRNTYNQMNGRLFPNLSNAENTDANNNIDFLSNGFKMRTSNGDTNSNGVTFIYYAVASSPFVTSTGITATAR